MRQVVDPGEGTNAAAFRVCFEPDSRDEILTTRVLNNRPFTQRLHMTEGDQQWAWTWPGDARYYIDAVIATAARAALDSPTSHLLPPLSTTAVGIGRPTEPGQVVIAAQASADPITVLVDVGSLLWAGEPRWNENFLLNALAQAGHACGSSQLLKVPNPRDPAELVRTVLSIVIDCGEEIRDPDSEFGMLFEERSRVAVAVAQPQPNRDALFHKANRLSYTASAAFGALTYGKIAFYLCDQMQNALVAALSLSVRGDGRPQELGRWTPTCRDLDAHSNLLYRNLALRDEFRNNSRELSEFPGWAPAAARAVQPLRTCTAEHRARLADLLPSDWGDPRAAQVVADAVRSPSGSAGSVVLGLGGTFNGTGLFASEDDVIAVLPAQLGEPNDVVRGSMCEAGGPAGRRVTWGNLTVLVVDDGAAYLADSEPRLEAEGPIVVGWEYWLIKTVSDARGLQTGEGIGLGAPRDVVVAAYPDASVGEDYAGVYAQVFRGDCSGITFSFAEGDVVIAISSGWLRRVTARQRAQCVRG